MKKALLLLTAGALFILSNAEAQIKKNATLIRTAISGATGSGTSSIPPSETKGKNSTINLGFGKAIKENLIVGVSASYNGYTYEFPTEKRLFRSYGGGFFLRKYHQLGKSDFYLFANGNLDANFSKQSIDPSTNGTTTKTTDITLSVSPGVSYAVNKWLQLETGLNSLANFTYIRQRSFNDISESKGNSFSGGLNIGGTNDLYIGLSFLIN